MEEKKSVKEITPMLKEWAKSQGKKPRQWAKIPVHVLFELCDMMENASSAEMRTVCERARGWQAETVRLRRLLARTVPFLEGAMAIVRRSCELAQKQGGAAGMEMLRDAENQSRELSQVLGEARAEARRGEE